MCNPDAMGEACGGMNVRKPSVIDPMEPEATVSVDLGPPNLTNIGCASSYKPCGKSSDQTPIASATRSPIAADAVAPWSS